MASESNSGKDTLKVEKFSILVLTVCIGILVYVLIWHPF